MVKIEKKGIKPKDLSYHLKKIEKEEQINS